MKLLVALSGGTPLSVTLTVTRKTPVADGVQAMAPLVLTVRPVGPDTRANVREFVGRSGSVAGRTIENIALKNGTTITLGKSNVRSGNARFERVEITPAGGGAALVFNAAMLRTGGPRGNWQYFAFPGADGAYTLKVTYKNDSSGESTYAVSIRDPRPEPAPAPVPKPPAPPASESK